jgi:hypothetical protein
MVRQVREQGRNLQCAVGGPASDPPGTGRALPACAVAPSQRAVTGKCCPERRIKARGRRTWAGESPPPARSLSAPAIAAAREARLPLRPCMELACELVAQAKAGFTPV